MPTRRKEIFLCRSIIFLGYISVIITARCQRPINGTIQGTIGMKCDWPLLTHMTDYHLYIVVNRVGIGSSRFGLRFPRISGGYHRVYPVASAQCFHLWTPAAPADLCTNTEYSRTCDGSYLIPSGNVTVTGVNIYMIPQLSVDITYNFVECDNGHVTIPEPSTLGVIATSATPEVRSTTLASKSTTILHVTSSIGSRETSSLKLQEESTFAAKRSTLEASTIIPIVAGCLFLLFLVGLLVLMRCKTAPKKNISSTASQQEIIQDAGESQYAEISNPEFRRTDARNPAVLLPLRELEHESSPRRENGHIQDNFPYPTTLPAETLRGGQYEDPILVSVGAFCPDNSEKEEKENIIYAGQCSDYVNLHGNEFDRTQSTKEEITNVIYAESHQTDSLDDLGRENFVYSKLQLSGEKNDIYDRLNL